MTNIQFAHVSDRELIDATCRAAADARGAIADLIALLGEVDARRLYLGEGYSSLFAYCTHELKLSEHEAYHRIEAARGAREFPEILDRLREGSLTLTSITLLRPHLSPENANALILNASNKPKREVEAQMAVIAPKPDAKAMVRRLPAPSMPAAPTKPIELATPTEQIPATAAPVDAAVSPPPRSMSVPLSTDRFLLRVTLSSAAHAKLQRAKDLMRHSVPDGDPAAIVERALDVLVEDLERRRLAQVSRPRSVAGTNADAPKRHVPASVRREVWARDEGRCAFVGRKGRCRETGGLEFHHVEPFALGGETTAANLELRCRAHNQYEGELWFGPRAGVATARPTPSHG